MNSATLDQLRNVIAQHGNAEEQCLWREIEHKMFETLHFPADDYNTPRQRGLAIRDSHIRAAYSFVQAPTKRQRIEVLKNAIRRFLDTWRRIPHNRLLSEVSPPERLNDLQRELFHAFQTASHYDLPIPGSKSTLYAILSRESANDWKEYLL